MSRNTGNYGELYWCVRTPQSKNGEIYFFADQIDVTSNGDLVAWAKGKREVAFQVLALASGQWTVFFAASVVDGSAVACEHWAGEILENEKWD